MSNRVNIKMKTSIIFQLTTLWQSACSTSRVGLMKSFPPGIFVQECEGRQPAMRASGWYLLTKICNSASLLRPSLVYPCYQHNAIKCFKKLT